LNQFLFSSKSALDLLDLFYRILDVDLLVGNLINFLLVLDICWRTKRWN